VVAYMYLGSSMSSNFEGRKLNLQIDIFGLIVNAYT